MSFVNSTTSIDIEAFASKQLRQDCLGPVGSFFDEFFDSRRLFEDLCLEDDLVASAPNVCFAPFAISGDDEEDSDGLPAITAEACSIPIASVDRNSHSPLLSPSDTESFASTTFSFSSSSFSSSRHQIGKSKSSSDDDNKTQSKRERNRQAAERCRKRKADLIASLQFDCDQLRQERNALVAENKRLRAMLGVESLMQM